MEHVGNEQEMGGRQEDHDCVMNMTFARKDQQRSQLLIEPTHSQIGCMDQELSQLQGFSEICICRNNEVLSAQN
jgi:hypothetical protein